MIALTGAGSVLLGPNEPCDPTPFLRTKKSRKYMGLQDDLAVVAAGRALASAGLTPERLGERAGLYLAVGYIPFLDADIEPVLAASMNDAGDRFDVQRFGAGGFQKAHPLLTFRCLPNMPAYHVSACFDVQGPYFVTYPGPSEFYSALEEANLALESGAIDVALVGAVAAQSNFLVRHHFARLEPPETELHDVAAMLVLEREPGGRARTWLKSLERRYEPPSLERYAVPTKPAHETLEEWSLRSGLGPAAVAHSLALIFANADEKAAPRQGKAGSILDYALRGRDGVHATCVWETR